MTPKVMVIVHNQSPVHNQPRKCCQLYNCVIWKSAQHYLLKHKDITMFLNIYAISCSFREMLKVKFNCIIIRAVIWMSVVKIYLTYIFVTKIKSKKRCWRCPLFTQIVNIIKVFKNANSRDRYLPVSFPHSKGFESCEFRIQSFINSKQ